MRIRVAVLIVSTAAALAAAGVGTVIAGPSARTHKGAVELAVASVTRGKKVFVQTGCGACHTFRAAGAKGTIGPNLDKALKGKSAAYIRQSIVKPNAVIAKGYKRNIMPSTYARQLSKQQLADLVLFLVKSRRK
jgi:mono/diheme cytochrome c family protein